MTGEWIKAISVRNKYKDLNLIEKVIRSLYLLRTDIAFIHSAVIHSFLIIQLP